MKKITVNGKDYKLEKVIDFNAICELEDLGISLSDIKKSRMSTIRGLLAFVADITPDEAGEEIMNHIKNGNSFDDFIPLINYLLESDFFQATRQPETPQET